MDGTVPANLRLRLRSATREAHEALDAQVSAFEISTESGLRSFLAMQVQALSALMPVSGRAGCAPILEPLRDRARDDLAALSGRVPESAPVLEAAPHPLALDYVIAGSRLGTVILKQRWKASTDPAVLAAGNYFGAPDYIACWKDFCTSAAEMDASCAISDRIVADVAGLFDFYRRCAQSAVSCERERHV
ncbi:biliverdin-producing heme oxygenase [Tropicimonas sediminicola]|uniref:Heme oxygenase n=1 Tax=Tropicimonas sediminicola TaxID=1031541 RepID=A0A239J9W2_9RHOB|nr:biliverdin-producing heme oxygenase [Tropicimonas sediminicola]SNT02806.1 heme oxygenase [Tropicimonas sediminicola]